MKKAFKDGVSAGIAITIMAISMLILFIVMNGITNGWTSWTEWFKKKSAERKERKEAKKYATPDVDRE